MDGIPARVWADTIRKYGKSPIEISPIRNTNLTAGSEVRIQNKENSKSSITHIVRKNRLKFEPLDTSTHEIAEDMI